MPKPSAPSPLVSVILGVMQLAFITACVVLAFAGVILMFVPSSQ